MSTYFVTYTLKDSTDYTKLSKRLKKYPNWAKLFARAWIINTSHSSKKVRDELVEAIEGKGQVVVINITDSAWATYDIDENLLEWMKENICYTMPIQHISKFYLKKLRRWEKF